MFPGIGLTLVVDVVGADGVADEVAFLEAELLVVVAKTDIGLKPLVVPSR